MVCGLREGDEIPTLCSLRNCPYDILEYEMHTKLQTRGLDAKMQMHAQDFNNKKFNHMIPNMD